MSRPSGVHSDSPSSPLAAAVVVSLPSFLFLLPRVSPAAADCGWAAALVLVLVPVPVPAAPPPRVVPPLPDLGRLMPARAAAVLVPVAEAAVLVILLTTVITGVAGQSRDGESLSVVGPSSQHVEMTVAVAAVMT